MKNWLEDWLNKVSPKKSNNKEEVILNEVIKRSERFLQEYKDWIETNSHHKHLKNIKTSLALLSQEVKDNFEIIQLVSPGLNGIAIPFQTQYFTHSSFEFLFEFFKRAIKAKYNYIVQLSQHTITQKNTKVTETHKYYLKPRVNPLDTPINQQFGNLTIELIANESVPQLLKIGASSYSGLNYSEVLPFDSFLDSILNNEG